jgi:hypothetical protein
MGSAASNNAKITPRSRAESLAILAAARSDSWPLAFIRHGLACLMLGIWELVQLAADGHDVDFCRVISRVILASVALDRRVPKLVNHTMKVHLAPETFLG